MVVEISLKIPDGKVDICEWLKDESPEAVANILELAKVVYEMNKFKVVQTADTKYFMDCINNWENKYKNVLLKHQDELDDVISRTKMNYMDEINKLKIINKELNELIHSNGKKYRDEMDEMIVKTREMSKKEYEVQLQMMYKSRDDDKKHWLKLLEDSKMENNKMYNELTSLTKLFTGSASNTGIVGENLVHYTFNTLQLGVLEDMRYDLGPGCEDFLWSYNEMNCSVEVKNSKCLHSKHDMDKHYKRVQEAVGTGKINCGMFLSLNARVPNMSSFEIQTHFGVPILYVSKQESVSHQVIIELSFRLMNVIWKIHNTNKTEDQEYKKYNNVFNDISAVFSIQVNNISCIEDSIINVEKNIQQVFAQIQKLKKHKTEMLSSIHSFYDKYPITKPVISNETNELSETQRALVAAIIEFHAKRRKYPKEIVNVKYYLDEAYDFYEVSKEFQNEFQGIVEFVKKNKKKFF